MLKIFLKNFLKYLSFSLLIIFVLSGCASNNSQNNNSAVSNNTEQQNKQSESAIINIDETLNKFLNGLEEKIVKNWPKMNEIWPGLDYTKNNAIIFLLGDDEKPLKAWLINTSGKMELSFKEYSNIKYPYPGGFSKLKFEDKDSIMLSVNKNSLKDTNGTHEFINDTYGLITHELVHFYYQNDLSVKEGSRNQ